MVATAAVHHLLARSERRMVDFDPATAGDEMAILDFANTKQALAIANFRRFVAGFKTTIGTGGITVFRIFASTDAVGTGITTVVQHALGSNPDSVNDHLWLECDVEQIREVLPTATHVGVEINLVTGTDEATVFFERADPFYPAAGLTADYVS